MINAFWGVAIVAQILYGLLIDSTWWKIYGFCVFCYFIFVVKQRNLKENPTRKNLMISMWNGKLYL
jgi:hypothetical protein